MNSCFEPKNIIVAQTNRFLSGIGVYIENVRSLEIAHNVVHDLINHVRSRTFIG